MKPWMRLIGMLCMVVFMCFGCGGSGSDGGSSDNSKTSVSGAAVKGLVKGGTVNVYACVDGQKSALLGTTTTSGTDGTYRINLGAYTGPVLIEVSGGTYHDEATGINMTLSGTLRAALGNASGGVTAAVTPLTELAVRKIGASGNFFLADVIEDTNTLISQLLGGDGTNDLITQLIPTDASSDAATSASQAEKEYGLVLAAISQLAKDNGVDVNEVIDNLEEDLTDNVLDDTGAELVAALNEFMGTDNNKTGLAAADVASTIGTYITDTLKPTGDLATAKALLSALLQEPNNTNYDNFKAYIDQFTPSSKAAYLFKAIAELFALYSDSDISTIMQAVNIDDIADFKTGLSADQIMPLIGAIIATDNTNIDKILDTAIERLDAVDTQLALAEGVKTNISLTGFDTVYLDDIDVKVLRAFTAAFKAGLTYMQAVDLSVSTWQVNLPDGYPVATIDIRTLLYNDAYADLKDSLNENDDDNDVWSDFLDNNASFLKYRSDAAAKLTEFQTLYAMAVSRYAAAMDALNDLGSDGRNKRWQNAFNISTDYEFYKMKLLQDYTLPSIEAAFTNASAGVKLPIDEKVAERCVVVDGYAYYQVTMDVSVGTYAPASEITIYRLLNRTHTLRDLVVAELADEDNRLFSEDPDASSVVLYADNTTWIGWEEPFYAFTVPVATISVTDNSMTDWDDVEAFYNCGTHEIKLARDSSNQNLYIYYHIRDEFPFTLVCPWTTNRNLSLSCIMPVTGGDLQLSANAYLWLYQSCDNGIVGDPSGGIGAEGNDTELGTSREVFYEEGRVIASEIKITGENVKAFFSSGSFNWFTWDESQHDGSGNNYSKYLAEMVKLLPEM